MYVLLVTISLMGNVVLSDKIPYLESTEDCDAMASLLRNTIELGDYTMEFDCKKDVK